MNYSAEKNNKVYIMGEIVSDAVFSQQRAIGLSVKMRPASWELLLSECRERYRRSAMILKHLIFGITILPSRTII